MNIGQWYYSAVVNDGSNLSLYLDSNDGNGYVLQGTTPVNGAMFQGRMTTGTKRGASAADFTTEIRPTGLTASSTKCGSRTLRLQPWQFLFAWAISKAITTATRSSTRATTTFGAKRTS